MKKLLSIIISLLLITNLIFFKNNNIYANEKIKVYVDANNVYFNESPILDNDSGRVLVPMREIFNSLGYSVNWIGNEGSVGNRGIIFGEKLLGNSKAEYNIRTIERTIQVKYTYDIQSSNKPDIDFMLPMGKDSPIKIINGKTMLPTRILAESLGCNVAWDGKAKTVYITSKNSNINYPSDRWVDKLEAHLNSYAPNLLYEVNNYRNTSNIIINNSQLTPPQSENITTNTFREDVINLTNLERQNNSIFKLNLDSTLHEVAQQRANEMAKTKVFSHVLPTLKSPFDNLEVMGYKYSTAGENIAKGQQSPEDAIASWMASTKGHRENILSENFTEIGVGFAIDDQNNYYWVQVFAKKL